ncbi:hypothetical protein AWZ03_014210 [Drosophila navojoa]|uniref:Uncharacterized protein n=1 Tax=Drosophila navojoa TaxID=7232 RepID=A0A484AS04_DRONA|nr:hypothetical protein AWZ03_014210 [Drosophila navojoa]
MKKISATATTGNFSHGNTNATAATSPKRMRTLSSPRPRPCPNPYRHPPVALPHARHATGSCFRLHMPHVALAQGQARNSCTRDSPNGSMDG